MEYKLVDFKTPVHNDWCAGCGDFGILNAIQMSLYELEIARIRLQFFPVLDVRVKPLILLIHLEYTHYMEESCPLLKEPNWPIRI